MRTEDKEITGFYSLKELLNSLKDLGIKSKDYQNVSFTLDYRGCYYEGDIPTVKAIIEIPEK